MAQSKTSFVHVRPLDTGVCETARGQAVNAGKGERFLGGK